MRLNKLKTNLTVLVYCLVSSEMMLRRSQLHFSSDATFMLNHWGECVDTYFNPLTQDL